VVFKYRREGKYDYYYMIKMKYGNFETTPTTDMGRFS
jgi:hypothetical protein